MPRSLTSSRTSTELADKFQHALSAIGSLQETRAVVAPITPALRRRGGKSDFSDPGRQLSMAAAILAFSVLADSGVEHYRGSFENRAMYTPLAVGALTLTSSLFGAMDRRQSSHSARSAICGLAAATGVIGLGFHAYNVLKRPGRLSWINLFYGAPIGAPAALTLAGLLGAAGEHVRAGQRTIAGRRSGRALAALVAAGLAGTVGEAGLLHFRGAFQNPAMLLPVSLPPIAATLLGAAAARPRPTLHRLARAWLKLTALLGIVGVGFHAYGISRAMGGWRNWSQNILNGPPLPAPPSFTGLAIAGLAALTLSERDEHD
jgi:heme/copper-type cytochrome/quinol oxidase subunit 3